MDLTLNEKRNKKSKISKSNKNKKDIIFGPTIGATRDGELSRTSEMLVEIAKEHEGDALKIVAETLFIIRSTNRTETKDLIDLQKILDMKLKNRKK